MCFFFQSFFDNGDTKLAQYGTEYHSRMEFAGGHQAEDRERLPRFRRHGKPGPPAGDRDEASGPAGGRFPRRAGEPVPWAGHRRRPRPSHKPRSGPPLFVPSPSHQMTHLQIAWSLASNGSVKSISLSDNLSFCPFPRLWSSTLRSRRRSGRSSFLAARTL